MKPDTFYFPHDYHAHLDPKCCALINDFGMSGYGLYWSIIEVLHEQGGRIAKFPKLYDGLSRQFNVEKETLTKQIEAMLHDYELLLQDDKFIWSERVLRNIQEREAKKMLRAEAGKLGGIKSGVSRRKRSKTKQCFEANEANEPKKRKEKEIKENNIAEIVLPEGLNKEVWDAYVEMRKNIKSPITNRAARMILNRLALLSSNNGKGMIPILEQSIRNNWKDVYPIKDEEIKREAAKSKWTA